MSKPENPRAFPSAAIDDQFGGMTMRDWFAGQALAGMVGHPKVTAASLGIHAAKRCYELADAMLAERAKGRGK
ncbi:hypothetical protein [Rhizorhabdus wittichii]|uniref:hypothetical protein n=1 Tax=Rhizorhabdus wittichii TaxID=160791 RepID=UPI000361143B|nr:hypothetical protein [Rhizorhabdus wittichii]